MAEQKTESRRAWECPFCKKSGSLIDVKAIFDDTRFDVFKCECGASWRQYYKMIPSGAFDIVSQPTPKEEPEKTDVVIDAPSNEVSEPNV